VIARDAAGNVTTSAGATVTVGNAGAIDASPPVISQVSMAVTASAATIGWATNEPSTTQVEYGAARNYGAVAPLHATLAMSHSQTITVMTATTWYYFRVRSRDAAGSLGVSRDCKFKMRSR
jgi:hypothetical protein